jgi:hypothetical protein
MAAARTRRCPRKSTAESEMPRVQARRGPPFPYYLPYAGAERTASPLRAQPRATQAPLPAPPLPLLRLRPRLPAPSPHTHPPRHRHREAVRARALPSPPRNLLLGNPVLQPPVPALRCELPAQEPGDGRDHRQAPQSGSRPTAFSILNASQRRGMHDGREYYERGATSSLGAR